MCRLDVAFLVATIWFPRVRPKQSSTMCQPASWNFNVTSINIVRRERYSGTREAFQRQPCNCYTTDLGVDFWWPVSRGIVT